LSSDLEGGYGGMDLYYSDWNGIVWTSPVNCGSEINTQYNEIFPSMHNGILYFSSDRKTGEGGLDIYSYDFKEIKLGILEKPLNTASDDFGIFWGKDGKTGYLSSNRNGNDDVFYFHPLMPEFDSLIVCKEKYCYTFFEEASSMNLDTVGMTYEWDFGNGSKELGLEVKHCFPGPGLYPVNLNIVDASSGEVFSNEVSYEFEVERPTQLCIDTRDTVFSGEILNIDASRSLIVGYTIQKCYWDFNDGKYSTGYQVRHKYLKEGSYEIRFGVVARNDSTGKVNTFYNTRKITVIPLSMGKQGLLKTKKMFADFCLRERKE
jgi:hypothetical protein